MSNQTMSLRTTRREEEEAADAGRETMKRLSHTHTHLHTHTHTYTHPHTHAHTHTNHEASKGPPDGRTAFPL